MIDMALEENLGSRSEFTFVVMVSLFLNKVSLYESFGHGRQVFLGRSDDSMEACNLH